MVKAYPSFATVGTPLYKAAAAVVAEWNADPTQVEKLRRLDAPQLVLAEALLRVSPQSTPSLAPKATHEQAVAASVIRMYAKYPDLAASGNPFGDYYVRTRIALEKQTPEYFSADDWPERLGDECAKRWRTAQAQDTQRVVRVPTLAPTQTEEAEDDQQERRPTQRNGQPLPANWINPDRADTQWQAQQLRNQIAAMRRAAEQAEQEARRTREEIEAARRRY